jgi:hypothetical protein
MRPILKFAALLPILAACSNIEGELYTTNLDTTSFEFLVEYDTSYFYYYDDMPRTIMVDADASELEGREDFYEMFLSDENDRDIIEQVVQWIQSTTQDPKEQIQLAVTLVQNQIIYDHDKLENVGNWNVYYPMETLIWKKGVCSDKSLLLGKILVYLDYKICFFLFDDNNHMALGIKTNTKGFAESGFEFIETTNAFQIGAIPPAAPGQPLSLLSEAPQIVVPEYNGSKVFKEFQDLKREYLTQNEQFGQGYSTASVEAKKQMLDLTIQRDYLIKLETLYELLIPQYESGVVTYDSVKSVENRLDDRIEAYNNQLRELQD